MCGCVVHSVPAKINCSACSAMLRLPYPTATTTTTPTMHTAALHPHTSRNVRTAHPGESGRHHHPAVIVHRALHSPRRRDRRRCHVRRNNLRRLHKAQPRAALKARARVPRRCRR